MAPFPEGNQTSSAIQGQTLTRVQTLSKLSDAVTALTRDELLERMATFAAANDPLPGLEPYVNQRPMSVGLAFEGVSLFSFLRESHPHQDPEPWRRAMSEGRISVDGRPVRDPNRPVRAGNRVLHEIPNTTEPWVNPAVGFIYEDEQILVLDKAAPLPMHPCGRFNKNSLVPMLRAAFEGLEPRPVHRLDADTTGVVVLAKQKEAARRLGEQFESRRTDKRYLARVHGTIEADEIELFGRIAREPNSAGKRRLLSDEAAGRQAETSLRVLERCDDSTLVELRPHSGRTNQLRIHLAELGHPIVGDSAYGKGAAPLGVDEAMSGRSDLCLHAWKLRLEHPADGRKLEFIAEAPQWGRAGRIG